MESIVRIGKVTAIDYKKGMASVNYTDKNNAQSLAFPLLNSAYDMPELGDTVVVLLLPNSTTKGFILGSPWSSVKQPEKGGNGIFYKEFPGGAYVKYNEKEKLMEVAADNIKLQLVTAKDLTVNGEIKAKKIVADSIVAEEVEVKKTASFKDLEVSGIARIENLYVVRAFTREEQNVL